MMVNSALVAGVKNRILRSRIQEQRRDIGAVQDVLQIVGGGSLPLQRFLQLAVKRGQLLVQRLQLFLRRQQLLVRRLIFLLHRQCFFVDRLLLFAGNLQVVDGALQLRPRRLQFLLQFGNPRHVPRGRPQVPCRSGLRIVDEADQQQILAFAADRLHRDAERPQCPLSVACRPPAILTRAFSWLACWIAERAWFACPDAPWRADHAMGCPARRAGSGLSGQGNTGIHACG